MASSVVNKIFDKPNEREFQKSNQVSKINILSTEEKIKIKQKIKLLTSQIMNLNSREKLLKAEGKRSEDLLKNIIKLRNEKLEEFKILTEKHSITDDLGLLDHNKAIK